MTESQEDGVRKKLENQKFSFEGEIIGRIVAIGGGDLSSTEYLNKYAISIARANEPKLLFIGTASEDTEVYIHRIHEVFEKLSCEVRELSLTKVKYDNQQIDELLAWADIIYVGGGDTRSMMNVWKSYQLDRKLKDIYNEDSAVLMEISAGAICWFDFGHSEVFLNKENWEYIFVYGMLNIHHYALCPHYNEVGRSSFDTMLKDKDIIGLALENDTAFVDNNGKISFIKSREDANAYWLKYIKQSLEKTPVSFS